jgi:hypothetical protein
VHRLSEVEEKPLRWLWYPYLVRNKANIMEGDPGVGKSLLIALLAGTESNGGRMKYDTRPGTALGHPDADTLEADPGGNVLILGGEDDTADTIKPRVRAAGGNQERIFVLEKVPHLTKGKDGAEIMRYRRPRLPSDTSAILRIVRDEGIRLLIIDPLTSFLDKDVSPNNDAEIRGAFDDLVDGCAERNCTVLFTRHLNKGSGQSALHRGAGSIGIAGLARSVVMVAEDPDAPEGVDQHVLGHVKSNVAAKGATLVFQKFVADRDAVPIIDWQGTSTRKPDEIYQMLTQRLQGQAGEQRRERMGHQLSEQLQKAVDWLKQEFASMPGEGLPASEIIAHANLAHISDKLVRKAAAHLKVRQSKEGYQGSSYWYYDPPVEEDE